MDGDTDTLVSADSGREHDMEAIPEERDPELREVDDDVSHAPNSEDNSVDTDDREESVMGQEDHVPQVEEEDLELPLPEEQQSGMRWLLLTKWIRTEYSNREHRWRRSKIIAWIVQERNL